MSAGDKLALAMIPKIDIRCAAILMLKRYGEKALEENNAVSYFITTAGHSSFETETDTRLRTRRLRAGAEALIRAGGGRVAGVRYSVGYDADPTIGNSRPDSAPHMYARPEVRAGVARLAAGLAPELIAELRNCSSRGRSKSSLRAPLSASPVGSPIATPFDLPEATEC
jgi:hypothetical protein